MRAGEHSGLVTDGPFLYRTPAGTLLMLWSNFAPQGYATGYARSLSGEIMGPWIQEPTPLYAMDGAHSMLFTSFEGNLIMSLHAPNTHTRKHMLLFQMEVKNEKLHIVNEITGNWYNYAEGMRGRFGYREPYTDYVGQTKMGQYRPF